MGKHTATLYLYMDTNSIYLYIIQMAHANRKMSEKAHERMSWRKYGKRIGKIIQLKYIHNIYTHKHIYFT